MNGELELRHLRALIAIADEGTFTDAAIRLRVSQSAVSRTLSQFEQLVGATLVRRTTRTLELTHAGRRCYAAAVTAIRAVDEVARSASDATRPLRLGYSWAAFGRYTTKILQSWRREHAEVPVEIHRIDERTAGLRTGTVEMAVIRGDFDETGLKTRLLFSEGRLAAFPSGHRLANERGVTLADLAAETLAWTPTTGTTRLDLWPANAQPSRTIELDNIDEWLTVIAAGDAVGLTPESTAFSHSYPGIAYVRVTDVPDAPVRLAWPAVFPHPLAAAFADSAAGCIPAT